MKFYYSVLFIQIFTLPFLMAQSISPDVISSSGAHHEQANVGSISWTLGELVTETIGSSSLSISQGFHQSYKTTSSTKEKAFFEVNIYPNPTTDQVIIESNSGSNYTIKIMDLNGKIIKEPIQSNQIQNSISFAGFPSGTYLLLLENKIAYSQFKIIKQ